MRTGGIASALVVAALAAGCGGDEGETTAVTAVAEPVTSAAVALAEQLEGAGIEFKGVISDEGEEESVEASASAPFDEAEVRIETYISPYFQSAARRSGSIECGLSLITVKPYGTAYESAAAEHAADIRSVIDEIDCS